VHTCPNYVYVAVSRRLHHTRKSALVALALFLFCVSYHAHANDSQDTISAFLSDVDVLPEGHQSMNVEQTLIAQLLERNKQLLTRHYNKLDDLVSDTIPKHEVSGRFTLRLFDAPEPRWTEVKEHYYVLDRLAKAKSRLIELAEGPLENEYIGYGRTGLRQIKQEFRLHQLAAQIWIENERRLIVGFPGNSEDRLIEIIFTVIQLLIATYFLVKWQRHAPTFFKLNSQREVQTTPGFMQRASPYLAQVSAPIGWLIFLNFVLSMCREFPLLEAFYYLKSVVTGVVISISVIRLGNLWLEQSANNREDSQRLLLSKKSFARFVWTIAFVWIVLRTVSQVLYEGAIYYWLEASLYALVVVQILTILKLWRNVVFAQVDKLKTVPTYIEWAISKKTHFIFSPLSALLCISHLSKLFMLRLTFSYLSRFDFFKQLLAYFFSIEVIKQTILEKEQKNLSKLGVKEAFNYVAPGNETSLLIDEYAQEQLDDLSKHVLKPVPAMAVVVCERGRGMTRFLKRLVTRSKSQRTLYIDCTHEGLAGLMTQLALVIGLEKEASEGEIVQALRKAESRYLFCIDNAHRLVSPKVNGIESLIKFTNILRRGRGNHGAVLGIEQSSWRFVERARGERLILDRMIHLPSWTEQQLAQLMESRMSPDETYQVHFDDLNIPKQWDDQELDEEETAKVGFFRILWNYSGGNPTVALRFFRMSLFTNTEKERVVVRIFRAPDDKELEALPKPMLAVLRAIVQLEIASPEELAECTQLSYIEVLNTLRFFQNRGFISLIDDKAKVSDHWYRFVTNTLHNQHLLVK
jgi:hypothetical protein